MSYFREIETGRTLDQARYNEGALYALNVFSRSPAMTIPVLLPFINRCGMSVAQFFWLQAGFVGLLACLQVPTGYFADRIGRKTALVTGALLWTVSMLIYGSADCVATLVVAEVVWAFGSALVSGADAAKLRATLEVNGRGEELGASLGRMSGIGQVAEVPLFAIGGLLSLYDMRLPFFGAAALLGALVLILTGLTEFKQADEEQPRAALEELFKAGRYVFGGNALLAWLVMFQALLLSFTLTAFWFTTPLLLAHEVPESQHGLWFAGMAAVIALANWQAASLQGKLKALPLWLVLGLVAGFAGPASGSFTLMLAGLFCQKLAFGVAAVVCKERIANQAPRQLSATVLSFAGMFMNLVQLVLLTLCGVLLACEVPLQIVLGVCGAMVAVGGALLLARKP